MWNIHKYIRWYIFALQSIHSITNWFLPIWQMAFIFENYMNFQNLQLNHIGFYATNEHRLIVRYIIGFILVRDYFCNRCLLCVCLFVIFSRCTTLSSSFSNYSTVRFEIFPHIILFKWIWINNWNFAIKIIYLCTQISGHIEKLHYCPRCFLMVVRCMIKFLFFFILLLNASSSNAVLLFPEGQKQLDVSH